MNHNEINNLDPNDIGLKQIMGNRFHDGIEKPVTAEPKKVSTDTTTAENKRLGIPDEAKDAIWSPFSAEPSFTQKLMNCAKWASLFTALYLLFYYWECTGQMQPSASVPAMTVCACMVGWSFGKYAFRGNR
jgi:hypothetical protein